MKYAALVAVLVVALFWRVFLPGQVQFSNDGPFGQVAAQQVSVPQGFLGIWTDLNGVGGSGGSYAPSSTPLLRWILTPYWFSKFYCPIALIILGLGAFAFYHRLGLLTPVAFVTAMATALNGLWFSTACWGVAGQQIAAGFVFMALALLTGKVTLRRAVLAGACVGINIMEAADIGALYAIFVAIYASLWWKTLRWLPLVAIAASLVSAAALDTLVHTQIKGIAGTQQDTQTKEARWNFATQWSFPKREVLSMAVPGLFGYRMDAQDGAAYWGVGGRDASWWAYLENGHVGPQPVGFLRQAGGGAYLGVVCIVLVGLTLRFFTKEGVESFQRLSGQTYFWNTTGHYRQLTLFFWVVLVVCLLLAFGKFAPFFQFVYALPYASTVRNPGKFLNLFAIAFCTLVGFGLQWCVHRPIKWWPVIIGIPAFGFLVWATSGDELRRYIASEGFSPEDAARIFTHSCHAWMWCVGVLCLLLVPWRRPANHQTAWWFAGLMLLDLGMSDVSWIKPVNVPVKYQSNYVVDDLTQWTPANGRVAILPFPPPPQLQAFDALYRTEWLQHLFPYFGVQSLDVIQMPRVPQDWMNFNVAMSNSYARLWTLTSTRYLMGPAGFLESLNAQLDPKERRFSIRDGFTLIPKRSLGTEEAHSVEQVEPWPVTNAPFALFEFAGALPRARTYRQWITTSNELPLLSTFNEKETVLVHEEGHLDLLEMAIPQDGPADDIRFDPGSTPTHRGYRVIAHRDCVLLVNDKYDPGWSVTVDGNPATLLRCNYLMRGVKLSGKRMHWVYFTFRVSHVPLALSLISLGVVALFIYDRKKGT